MAKDYPYMVEIIGPHGVRYRNQNSIKEARKIAYSFIYDDPDNVGCRFHKNGREIGKAFYGVSPTGFTYTDFVKKQTNRFSSDGSLGKLLVKW